MFNKIKRKKTKLLFERVAVYKLKRWLWTTFSLTALRKG